MERYGDENEIVPFHQYYATDFGLIDFMDEANFDHFIDLIRGENNQTVVDEQVPIFNFCNEDYQNSAAAAVVNDGCHFLPPPPLPVEMFDFEVATSEVAADFGLVNACDIDGVHAQQAEEEEGLLMDEDESSGSGATTTRRVKGKADRSRTLVSERRRRGRMKEKLYALRSLVPNITKMDKASIVGDAVLYMEGLQMQAKKLRAEIARLESGEEHKTTTHQSNSTSLTSCFYPIPKKIFKMDVCEVEERGYYVRIVSNKGKGVAMLLYRALESLTSFDVRTSNLAASAPHNYVFTFTLHTMDGGMDVNLQSVKVWVATVFLHHGFEFQTLPSTTT